CAPKMKKPAEAGELIFLKLLSYVARVCSVVVCVKDFFIFRGWWKFAVVDAMSRAVITRATICTGRL
ncbi:hypothetical protein, partial [Klebsiella pneumoniae]|uniref:hypothetical protein n=1 Tax=Klebsiella pneumoniae TaxID=573 RepID=UPI003EE0ED1B